MWERRASLALAQQLPQQTRSRLVLHGYETDPHALGSARQLLAGAGVGDVDLRQQDFLALPGEMPEASPNAACPLGSFDVVIANPPYVRTQVLGSARAQELAGRFGLSGRIDLYQAFAQAMANVLRPGGVLGLLASNRFLSVRSGAALRRLLRTEFELAAIYDLGDTKLFAAAVLPVVVVAHRRLASVTPAVTGRQLSEPRGVCRFDRVYACRSDSPSTPHEATAAAAGPPAAAYPAILDAFRDRQVHGIVSTAGGRFKIERGVLQTAGDGEAWSLSTADSRRWLETVEAHQRYSFEDVAQVRVGIKTTADEVFIRDDWESLPADLRPEEELLHPLATHLIAARWFAVSDQTPQRPVMGKRTGWQVLYPHALQAGKRVAVDLARYPRARAYLEAHRQRLARRKYVIEAGRQWYEIWVPHHPADWAGPKIVFPDIAEGPRFFLDSTGALVNGDCYWMTLRPGFERAWLYLILAVANSSFITAYYDLAFHNKLYAGRRRYMTQYVRRFPLPDISTAAAKEMVELVARLVNRREFDAQIEARIDGLVWQSFGLAAG